MSLAEDILAKAIQGNVINLDPQGSARLYDAEYYTCIQLSSDEVVYLRGLKALINQKAEQT